jgi:hypothetical protein
MAVFPRGATAEHAFAEHEHRDLAPGIDRIHNVVRVAGSITAPGSSIALLDLIDWIDTVFEPHAPGRTPGSIRRSTVEPERRGPRSS